MDEQQEELLTRLNYAVFGLRGNNGLIRSVDDHRREFQTYVAKEDARRVDDLERQRAKDRTIAIAAISSLVGLIGVVVTLVVVLTQAGP